ncbi:hypothetical protein [Gallaecimonas mangrovi]|uniref:hypothetical protein n=1 Tax=Gallaecimonas mangrovi TaxID=2291597 RepID=UPI00186927A8|nr:hypothetical protein [Gallaecimonas mangrovi]
MPQTFLSAFLFGLVAVAYGVAAVVDKQMAFWTPAALFALASIAFAANGVYQRHGR